MCGRLTLTVPDPTTIAGALEAGLDARVSRSYRPRYNAAPTDLHPIVLLDAGPGRRRVVLARWGFPVGDGERAVNARSETAPRKAAFREAFATRRCAIPADGFYEWEGPPSDRRPLWFHLRDGGLFFFAGLWEQAADELAFTILTTPANAQVRRVHDRMPVILDGPGARRWMQEPSADLLSPAPEELLAARKVSLRVNAVYNDDPGCLELAEAPAAGPSQMPLL